MKAFPYADKNQEIFFIAEIGSNHNNDKQRLEDLILYSKNCNFDAIKLQYYNPDTLWSKEFPIRREQARQGMLSKELLIYANQLAQENNIAIGCSVFDLNEVEFVSQYVDFLKIASYEAMWFELIDKCKSTGKPLFLSTGMCTIDEIIQIKKRMEPTKEDAMFHCITGYPVIARINNLALDILEYMTYINAYDTNTGYSDHTRSPAVIYTAVNIGAMIFEIHVDLDDFEGAESKYNHVWDFSRVLSSKVINNSKKIKHLMNLDRKELRFERKDRDMGNVLDRTDPIDGMRPMMIARKET